MSVAMKLSYKQDIKDPLVTQAPVTLLMQGDNQANVIELTLMDGASPASLDGYRNGVLATRRWRAGALSWQRVRKCGYRATTSGVLQRAGAVCRYNEDERAE